MSSIHSYIMIHKKKRKQIKSRMWSSCSMSKHAIQIDASYWYNSIEYSLQVGADGANSMVRKQMNVNTVDIKYNQMGLIATVELTEVSICAARRTFPSSSYRLKIFWNFYFWLSARRKLRGVATLPSRWCHSVIAAGGQFEFDCVEHKARNR